MKCGHVESRSWNAAIRAVQQNLLTFPAHVTVSAEQNEVLCAVYALCDQLKAKKPLPIAVTNRHLARKYAISPRTVTNWRKKGCPFDKGQWQVLDWMFGRPYLPEPAKQKFAHQLGRRLRRAARDIRAAFLLLNETVPDSIREICEG